MEKMRVRIYLSLVLIVREVFFDIRVSTAKLWSNLDGDVIYCSSQACCYIFVFLVHNHKGSILSKGYYGVMSQYYKCTAGTELVLIHSTVALVLFILNVLSEMSMSFKPYFIEYL